MGKVYRLEVFVVVDNTAAEPGFAAEWGLSVYLRAYSEEDSVGVLFDFGQRGDTLLANLEAAGLGADKTPVLVLSHGHYDHAGGAVRFLENTGTRPLLLAHPAAFLPKLGRKGGVLRDIGLPFPKRVLEEKATLVETSSPVEVFDGVYFLGEIKRYGYPEYKKGMYTVLDGKVVEDPMLDDTGVAVNVEGLGLVVLTGCGHSGVLNVVRHAMEVTGVGELYAVLGGFHTEGAREEEVRRIVDTLCDWGASALAPMHCSGSLIKFVAYEKEVLLDLGSGSSVAFEAKG